MYEYSLHVAQALNIVTQLKLMSPICVLNNITTSRRFKCVIQKREKPLDFVAWRLVFSPLGIHFRSHRKRVE